MSAPTGGSQLNGRRLTTSRMATSDNPDNHPHQRLGMQQLGMIRAAFHVRLRARRHVHVVGGHQLGGLPHGVSAVRCCPRRRCAAVVAAPPALAHAGDRRPDWLAQIDAWYATQSSAAIQALDQMLDFDGKHPCSTIPWSSYLSEIGRAYDHDQKNVPCLVFGGKNTQASRVASI